MTTSFTDTSPELLERVLVCPTSRTPLERRGSALHSEATGRDYPVRADWIDFLPDSGSHGIGPALMHLPVVARVYEGYWRPTFVTLGSGEASDMEREMGWVERELEVARGQVIADVSCGPGTIGRRLAKTRMFSQVVMVDYAEAMLTQCARLARAEHLEGVTLVRADVRYLPFADGSLAGVHAGYALHMWESPEQGLSEVARSLRSGGVFVGSTVVRPEGTLAGLVSDVASRVSRVTAFDPDLLRNMLGDVGLVNFRAQVSRTLIRFRAEKAG